jgi:hypothetical protein
LERIRAEHERAIKETKNFREEYARSLTLDNGDQTLQKVGENQRMIVMSYQMSILQRKAERAEKELKEIKDKHERKLRHKKEMNAEKEKIIEDERLKNDQLIENFVGMKKAFLWGFGQKRQK